MVLCQDVRGERGENAFRKGSAVQEADVPALMALPWEELHVIEPEPGELHGESPPPQRAKESLWARSPVDTGRSRQRSAESFA
jgi:hypothetical protein